MPRETLFISHATPEDNEFSIWIASRLEMLGYKTWIDKNGLLGGERFWQTIQNEIRDNAIKVLLIYSKNICDKDGNLKEGLEKEISYAESIAKQENIEDFIIPLHIDEEAPYNAFIGANRLNHIIFDSNWADGFKQLLKKLEKDLIPKNAISKESNLSEWYENEYISNCSIVSKNELFYSSWWQIDEIPLEFYMFKFNNLTQAKAVRELNFEIPISRQSNILTTFDKDLNFLLIKENEEINILPEEKYMLTLNSILTGIESDCFPQQRDIENHFKNLLNIILSNILKKKGFHVYKMSNKKLAYFQQKKDDIKPVKFIYPYSNKKKSKKISGDFEDVGYWHYANSFQSTLFPFVGFSLKSHLLFTSDGFSLLSDDKKMHSLRRRKGKRFFNEEWRDLQLAFIQYLKDYDGDIKIRISKNNKFIKMKEWPEMFWSEVGYLDPNSAMDVNKIEDYQEIINEEIEEND